MSSTFFRLGQRLSARLGQLRAHPPVVFTRARVAFAAGAVTAMPALTNEDFFEHTFVTSKNPDDIVDFYSTEDFLQILGVFPFAISFVLAGVKWDLNRENTMAVHNAMEISFELTEREEETESGETVVAFFQKKERFKNFIPFTPFLMWDQTQTFGYNRRDDGTCEIFHRGESFNGPLPVRLLVQLHARYVIWATERHINSKAFGNGDLEQQEEQRSNIPLYALRDFLERLTIAQQVAIESAKIAAGGSTEEASRTLKKLQRLKETPTQAYVSTLNRRLGRKNSTIIVGDAETQEAIDSAFANLAKTKDGQAAAAAAVRELISKTEVEKLEPLYGGAFQRSRLKGYRSTNEVA